MENENSSSSDKEDNKEKKQKGFKGFMNKLRGSPRGSHDSTADNNGITNSPEKTEKVDDEKLTIEVDQISVNDEISQGTSRSEISNNDKDTLARCIMLSNFSPCRN